MSTGHNLVALPASVRRVHRLSPHMTRITLHAKAFAELRYRASDHYVRLLLPPDPGTVPRLPVTERWWPEMLAMPNGQRPILRNYTVAGLRPADAELDIDFVLHGDSGPATSWANRAAAGHSVGIIDQGPLHEVRLDAQEYLIVGDETALPAATGVLGALPPGISATALLEVPSEADQRELTSPHARVSYLTRRDPRAKPGSLLAEAVHDWRATHDHVVAWVAGESSMTTAVRRILVKSGIAKKDICFHGYFKYGKSQYEG